MTEIHDVMWKVGQLSITGSSPSVQLQCRQVQKKKYSSLSGLHLLATLSVLRNDFVVFTERKLPMKVIFLFSGSILH